MMRSLFAGVSGLRSHQVRMDVIGNNIANVNTTAFKASRVNFSDLFSQTLSGGSRPTTAVGGTNGRQIGLGVGVATIDTVQTGGSLQLTGKATDMAITGSGFFVLKEGSRFLYTRAGNFDLDAQGFLVNPATGQRVQGWVPNANNIFPTRDAANMADIKVPISDTQLPQATANVIFDQALNASSPTGTQHTTAFTVIDSLGRDHTLTVEFTKAAPNAWDVRVFSPGGALLPLTDPYDANGVSIAPAPTAGSGVGRIQFNNDGSLMDIDGPGALTTLPAYNITFAPGGGANAMNLNLNLNRVIQPSLQGDANTSTLRMLDYDGYTAGQLTGISVDERGMITGFYSNGNFREVGQVAMAVFANPGGLVKEANNNWAESVNSGLALVGTADTGGRGKVAANNLEMSNVDITAEFTNMIVTQRGFQANSRIITTSDELLQEVVNLKR